jgi:hypothetical protein
MQKVTSAIDFISSRACKSAKTREDLLFIRWTKSLDSKQ